MNRDNRLRAASELILELMRGDPNARAQEVLAGLDDFLRERELEAARIDALSQALFRVASLDFDHPVEVLHDGCALDAIAGSVNMLAEEIAARIDEIHRQSRALEASQEQLRQAQKMEAVGLLAGGIAHDFNNVLSVIMSHCALSLDGDVAAPSVVEDIAGIKRSAQRAAGLTRQLLAFSRQQVIAPTTIDVDELLTDLHAMLQRILGEDIPLQRVPCLEPTCLRGDPGQIEQVIMNLVVNARDAGAKSITIESSRFDHDGTPGLELASGPYVKLRVVDTGAGMDPRTLSRIFEPFFTTKGVGKGTGLGLSTAFGIMRQHGGTISVASQLGVGSTFDLYVPRVDGDRAINRRKQSADPVVRASANETVLVVEDDDSLRKLVVLVLGRAGYRVLATGSPGEAILLCEQHPGPIELLLSDVVMPQLSGRQLAERVAPLRPAMRVLYMSGHTDDAVVKHGVFHQRMAFLQKPITPEVLLRKLREVLDTPARNHSATESSSVGM